MKITTITVTAGRVIPHPFESYANLRPSLTLTASLDESEDAESAVRALQVKAETMIHLHMEEIHRQLQAEQDAIAKKLEEERARRTAEYEAQRAAQSTTAISDDDMPF